MAVLLVAGVGSFVDWRKEVAFVAVKLKQMEKNVVSLFASLIYLKCMVLRNGVMEEIHQDFVHVGDILLIDYGMKIPVDGICLRANQLKADESAMTGESDHMLKDSLEKCIERMEQMEMEKRATKNTTKHSSHDLPSPVLMSGTSISEGEGQMIAISVGDNSAIGQIRKTLEAET